jgi:hypothetical protein
LGKGTIFTSSNETLAGKLIFIFAFVNPATITPAPIAAAGPVESWRGVTAGAAYRPTLGSSDPPPFVAFLQNSCS